MPLQFHSRLLNLITLSSDPLKSKDLDRGWWWLFFFRCWENVQHLSSLATLKLNVNVAWKIYKLIREGVYSNSPVAKCKLCPWSLRLQAPQIARLRKALTSKARQVWAGEINNPVRYARASELGVWHVGPQKRRLLSCPHTGEKETSLALSY